MTPKIKDLRVFGLIWTGILSVVTYYPVYKSTGDFRLWSLLLGSVFLILSIISPKLLIPFYKIWVKFGEFIGNIISKVILTVVFFILIFPLGILLKATGKDFLRKNNFKKVNSYWIKREEQPGNIKYQF